MKPSNLKELTVAADAAVRLLAQIETALGTLISGAAPVNFATLGAVRELARDARGPLRAALQRLTTGDYGRTVIEPGDLPEMPEGGVPSPTKDR